MKKQQTPAPHPHADETHPHHHSNEVYVLRDWKEYLGESLLIVFSVLLALFLTEFINNIKEKHATKELLLNVKNELQRNKDIEQGQYKYETLILKNIDSALRTPAFQQKIISNGEFHLDLIAPNGVLHGDLNTIAWNVAQSQDVTAKVKFEVIAKITDIYNDQSRILKLEDEIGRVLLDRESRKPENIRQTLILIRDNYKGWSYDRTPRLMREYDDAIKAIGSVE